MITDDKPWLAKQDKVICFGDSLTAATSSYVEILQERLGPRGITVVKAGRDGDKTPWALTRLNADVIDQKPTAVSIFLGTNDAHVGRGRWADEPKVTPEAYRCNLVWIIHLCRLSGIKKFSITPPLWRYEGDLWLEYGDSLVPIVSPRAKRPMKWAHGSCRRTSPLSRNGRSIPGIAACC